MRAKKISLLIECPRCKRRLAINSKVCRTRKGSGCGLSLDKKTRQNTHYYIAYRLEKKFIWERFANREDAEAWRNERSGQFVKGTLKTIEDLQPKPQVATFGELADLFLGQAFNKSKKSYDTICLRVNSFREVFGPRDVGSIKNSEVRNYLAKRSGEVAPSTLDQEVSYAKTVIRQAMVDKKLPIDALDIFNGIKKTLKKKADGTRENAKNLILTNEEIRTLYQNINVRSRLPFVLLTLTGMREAEVLQLQWSGVNWEKGLIELKPESTKECRSKQIPLPAEVLPVLEGLYRGVDGKVFEVSKDGFIGDFRRACGLSGIKYGRKGGATAHTLRHTFVTRSLFMPQIYRRMLTGHSSSEMDESYSHPGVEDLRGAMESANKNVIFLPLPSK